MADKITSADSALKVDFVSCATGRMSSWAATSIAAFCVSICVGKAAGSPKARIKMVGRSAVCTKIVLICTRLVRIRLDDARPIEQ